MFDSEVVILTGAGASMPVGIPGMAGMVKEFKENHPKRSQARSIYDQIVRAGVKEDLEEVLQFCNRLLELQEKEMERALAGIVAPRGGNQLRQFRKRFGSQVDGIELLRRELIGWIGTVCLRFDREKSRAIYSRLLPGLVDKGIPVFTTNYDGVLDDVAADLGIAVADNFAADGRGRLFWDHSHRSFGAAGLKLVRMHGSIYWHVTRANGVIEKFRQPAPLNAEGRPVEQLLIFPTRFKDIYEQNYFPLYSAFTMALARARTLLVIGHSLRDEYLFAAVRERLKDTQFSLVVVDVRLPSTMKGLKGNILHLKGGVQDFSPLISRALTQEASTILPYLTEANLAVKRGRKPRVTILSGVPRYAEPGEELVVTAEIETLTRSYTWGLDVLRRNKWVPLFRSNARGQRIDGFGKQEVQMNGKLPLDLERGESYKIAAWLFSDEKSTSIASHSRKIRIRKS